MKVKRNSFYNCDCMELMKALPDKYIDLAIVDPPYGGVTPGGYMTNHMGGGIAKNKNDYHLSVWQCDKPPKQYFDELMRVSKNQIIWGGNYFASQLRDSQCWLVWNKARPEGFSFADVELAWTSFDLASRIFTFTWNGMLQGNMKNKEHKIHPTQKPVALYEWILSKYANEGDLILDTHVGSASSLIACHRCGFEYIGCELDEVYYKLASERLEREKQQLSLF